MRILALDIGGTAIKSAIANEKGEISELKEHDTNAKNGGPYVVERALEIAHGYQDFECIGISTTGQVDPKEGSIVYANENVPQYSGMQVKRIFEQEFQKLCSDRGNALRCRERFSGYALRDLWYGCRRGHYD